MSHEASTANPAGADRHHGSVRALTVALLEDEPHTRAAIAAKLAQSDGIELIASLATLAEMRASLQQRQPDVLIVDLELPDGSGLELAERLHDAGVVDALVFFTSSEEADVAVIAESLGEMVRKSRGLLELEAVVDAALRGSERAPTPEVA